MAGEIGTLCICAARYALSGNIKSASTVCRIIGNNARSLDMAALYTLVEDISKTELDTVEDGKYWLELLNTLNKELGRRL